MLNTLRIRLTALYLLFSMIFVILVGAGAYFLLKRNFEASTDLALRYRLVQQLQANNVPVPTQLEDEGFYRFNPTVSTNSTGAENQEYEEDEESEDDDEQEQEYVQNEPGDAYDEIHTENEYNSELASIFVISLDQGRLIIPDAHSSQAPIEPEHDALNAADQNGMDIRTIYTSRDLPVRLLTYRVNSGGAVAYIQLGRSIADQQNVLRQVLTGLLILSGSSLVLLTLGSWMLAGRSIKPAQRAFEQQQAFVANASHELRTPLTLMRASMELAGRSQDEAEAHSLMNDALQDVDHMSKLVKDLLLLSSVDAKTLQLNVTTVNLLSLFDEIRRKVERIEGSQGIRFIVNPSPPPVIADAERLLEILWILVDNALQYTPPGGEIHLDAQRTGKCVQVSVRDSGRGIPPDDLKHVFERFYRAHNGAKHSGAGLGLAIAKGLVESLGGKISITSQPGKGTLVTISLHPAHPD